MLYREYDNETLVKLRAVELEITDEISRICEKHNINWFLVGGSLLGAVRHKGFIPWDDDIDIGMMRKDYDLFIKYAQEELSNKYYLDCFETNKDYYLPFAKLRKNNTIFDEEENHNLNNHKGIYVDIIPIDNASGEDNIRQKFQAIMVRSITCTMFYKNKIRPLKKLRYKPMVVILSIFGKHKLMEMQDKIMRMYKDDNSEYVVILSGSYNYKKETNKRSIYFPVKMLPFEDRKYPGIKDYDTYLSKIYGNYMALPPKEKRVNHMPLEIIFDTTKKR